jgi:AraC-like DNA-binding protein
MTRDMIAAPNGLTDPPNDPVDEILAAMHLSGGVVIDTNLHGEWAVLSYFAPEECAQFFPITGALIGYHYVREGTLWASVEGMPPRLAAPGSIIVLPRNDPHLLYTAELEPVPANTLVEPGDTPGLLRIDFGSGDPVRLYCGILSTAEPEPPLLDRLPRLMVIEPSSDAQNQWVGTSLGIATGGMALPPADVGKLAELLVRATLREHLKEAAREHHGWLDGLRDRHVARCLSLIHRHFAEPIDMPWLSREVGLSRSALHERFVGVLGEPPMRYCTRWRLRHAADLLRDTTANTASIAYAAGYNSEAAFNRAFKREYGEPPAAWRRRKAEAMQPGAGLCLQ